MGKRKKLGRLFETASGESLDIMALLDSAISQSETCCTTCTLLEIAKKKTIKVFKKIEKTRKILDLIN